MESTVGRLTDAMVNVTILAEHMKFQGGELMDMMGVIPNSCAEYRTRQIEHAVVSEMAAALDALSERLIEGIEAIKEAQDEQHEEDTVPHDFDWNAAAKRFIE